MKPNIIIDRDIPYIQGVLEPYATVSYAQGSEMAAMDLSHTQVLLIRTRTRCTARVLERSDLSFVGTVTAGTDHVDADFCRQKGIRFVSAPGCNASAVAQWVITALFAVYTKYGQSLENKTLGIVGVGHIGSLVQAYARALGFKVLLNDPPRAAVEGPQAFVGLEKILKESDIVSLHVPLTAETLSMAGDDFFAAMKPGACFVNASRGKVVDEAALRRAHRHLGFVMLDVWNNEPRIDTRLLSCTHLATPHIAGYSLEGKMRATEMVVRDLARHFGWKDLYGFTLPLPPPCKPELRPLDRAGDSQKILNDLFSQIFPIFLKDRLLRENPLSFEPLRVNERNRREFSSCLLKRSPATGLSVEKLKALGFMFNN